MTYHTENWLHYLTRSASEKSIARLDLAIGIRTLAKDTSLQYCLRFVKAIDLNLTILGTHWVVHLIVLAVGVNLLNLLQQVVELTFLSATGLLSVCLICLCLAHALLCRLLLCLQRLHLVFRILLEILEFFLRSILISFGISSVLLDVLMDHFHDCHDALRFTCLASVITFPCCGRWRWCLASIHTCDRLFALLCEDKSVVLVER